MTLGRRAMPRRVTREFPIGPFRDAATAWLADPRAEADHAVPARAATVMLVRGAPVEVFMIERAATMDFAPSTWVFPGGRVDPQDAEVVARGGFSAPDLDEMARQVGLDADESAAVVVCALRELFEEAGVLLVDADSSDDTGADDIEARRRLEAHETTFAEVLGQRRLRADLVAAVDRWITPPFEQRRFDTWFFTAVLPDGASAAAVSRESQRGQWVRPQQMLDEMNAGSVRLLPPTRTALERLTRATDAAEALEQARASSYEPTRPEALMGPDGPYLRSEVNL